MDSSAGFEESINSFTHAKTGEKIYLDLKARNVVEVRPLCKRGSIPLGGFWVHVFQHPNNYPVYSYPYKKLYRAGSQYELQLRIDGLSLIINLATGCLTIKGPHVIDWFVSRFPGIMESYSSPPQQKAKELKQQYTEDEMKALEKECEKYYKHFLEDWPMEALETADKIMAAGRKNLYHEPIDIEGFLKGQDLETYSPSSDLLDSQETLEQLGRLGSGQVIQGNVLYRLWKSTLNVWFSDKEARVFIMTPYIDRDRLTDVCMLFLNHKLTACLDTMCVPLSNLYGKFAEVRRDTIKRFPPRDQVFIEYKIYSSVVYPVMDFMTSFIAMVKDGKASILQTNTCFDRPNFVTISLANVTYSEVAEDHFVKAYLDPALV